MLRSLTGSLHIHNEPMLTDAREWSEPWGIRVRHGITDLVIRAYKGNPCHYRIVEELNVTICSAIVNSHLRGSSLREAVLGRRIQADFLKKTTRSRRSQKQPLSFGFDLQHDVKVAAGSRRHL